jgi:peptidoglycan/LPS O-acetylase OafA/YrhL
MKARLQSLQVGRAVAALLVVAYHASGSIFGDGRFWGIEPLGGLFGFGHAGVSFFFVLSGFIIAAAHSKDLGRPDRLANYVMRRFIRVYPAYWIVLVPIVMLYLVKPEMSKPELAGHDVIVNSFLLIGLNSHASLAVAWTLFHEILFYLLFGVAIAHRRTGITLLSAWFILCLTKALAAPFLWPSFYPLAPVNLLFAGGLLVFLAARRGQLPAPTAMAGLGAAGFLTTGLLEVFGGLPVAAQLPLYCITCTAGLAGFVGLEQRLPIAVPSWAILLGDASYAIYLVHYPALSVLGRLWFRLVGRETVPVEIAFCVLLLFSTLIGIALHIAIEKPLVRNLNARWLRWQEGRRASLV